jgi:serpin B
MKRYLVFGAIVLGIFVGMPAENAKAKEARIPNRLRDRTLREVCDLLTGKKNPKGLCKVATHFTAPSGKGRWGANGFLINASKDWKEKGTLWDFRYERARSARCFQVIHPFKKGHILVTVSGDIRISTIGEWVQVGWSGAGSNVVLTKGAAFGQMLPFEDNREYQIASYLDSAGNYQLFVDQELVASATINRAKPLSLVIPAGVRPPGGSSWAEHKFEGKDLPQVLLPGQAGIIVGPLDTGTNVIRQVRFSPFLPANTSEEDITSVNESPKTDVKVLVAGNSEFAWQLYAKLKEGRKEDGNLFFSPYSISTALAMTWAGARGQTEKQMAQVLHFSLPQNQLHRAFGSLEQQFNEGDKNGGYELNVANALWGQKGEPFRKEFIDLVGKNYGAGLRELDFVGAEQAEKARKIINAWVEKKTKEKIKGLIGRTVLDSATLVLTNAIYFKGDWAIEFDKKETRDAPFKAAADKEVTVAMMHLKDKFKYAKSADLQIIELPYKNEDLSMTVLLPKKVDGLEELEKSLTLKNVNQRLGELRKQKVVVYLPKFKMTTGPLELSGILKSMGMKGAFSLPPADFSGMTGRKDLFISNVLHKAFVAVDEKGTEAAAATAVGMTVTAVRPAVVFRADHPFIFLIKDNRSGNILFIGRVVNPAKQA